MCLGIPQHEVQAIVRARQIERQVGAASFEDGQNADDEIKGTVQMNSYRGFRANSQIAQVDCQLIGARVEVAVGHAPAFELQGWRVRLTQNLGFELRRQNGKIRFGKAGQMI